MTHGRTPTTDRCHAYEMDRSRSGYPMTDEVLCRGCLARDGSSGTPVVLAARDYCDGCGVTLGPGRDGGGAGDYEGGARHGDHR